MSDKKQYSWLVVVIVLLALLIDQAIKFYVKLHFSLGEVFTVFPWFQICFVENDGMAFGIEWFDKLFLTLFRIIASGALVYYLVLLRRRHASLGYRVVVALVLAGAIGNIIDCLFYGLIFSASSYTEVANFVSFGSGYAPAFYGRVVDMLYFPLIHNAAGETLFFRPVFNFADSCITMSIFLILIFYRNEFNASFDKNTEEKDNNIK